VEISLWRNLLIILKKETAFRDELKRRESEKRREKENSNPLTPREG
jgi:hypothetical protein